MPPGEQMGDDGEKYLDISTTAFQHNLAAAASQVDEEAVFERLCLSLRGYPVGAILLRQDVARPRLRASAGPVALHETGWDTPPFSKTMKHSFACNLAAAFLAGSWSLDGLLERGSLACGKRPRWLEPLVRRVLTAFPGPTGDLEEDALIAFLLTDEEFARTWMRLGERLQ